MIAAAHTLATGRASDLLLPRLDENERILIETYDLVTAAADDNRRIEPAAEHERRCFRDVVIRQEQEIRKQRGVLLEEDLGRARQASLDRQAVRRTLVELG